MSIDNFGLRNFDSYCREICHLIPYLTKNSLFNKIPFFTVTSYVKPTLNMLELPYSSNIQFDMVGK